MKFVMQLVNLDESRRPAGIGGLTLPLTADATRTFARTEADNAV